MNQPERPPVQPPSPNLTPLPHSHILNYVTNLSTPTRVRRIAQIALRITALFHFLTAIGLGALLANLIKDAWRRSMSPSGFHLYTGEWIIYSILFLWLACGILQAAFAGPVKRAQPWPCRIIPFTLAFTIFGLCIAAASTTCMGITFFYNHDELPIPFRATVLALGIVGTLIFGVCALLTSDLLAWINWIAKNPSTDAPHRPFV